MRRRVKQLQRGLDFRHLNIVSKLLYVFIIFLVVSVMLILVYGLYIFNNKNVFQRYEGLELVERSTNENGIDLIILGVDKKQTGHQFIDAAVYLHVDFKHKITNWVIIDPDLALASNLTLRNSLNLRQDKGDALLLLEAKLALPIDKYVILDIDSFVNLLRNVGGVKVDNFSDFVDEDLNNIHQYAGSNSFRSGELHLSSEEVLGFIAADDDSRENKLARQHLVTRKYLTDITSLNAVQIVWKVMRDDALEIKSNLSNHDVYQLMLRSRQIDDFKFAGIYMSDKILAQRGKVGIYPVYELNEESFDDAWQNIYSNFDLEQEAARVVVMNGTNQAGVANIYARKLKNGGVLVTHLGNNPNNEQSSAIYVHQKEKDLSLTSSGLTYLLNKQFEYVSDPYEYRAYGDITIVIGENSL